MNSATVRAISTRLLALVAAVTDYSKWLAASSAEACFSGLRMAETGTGPATETCELPFVDQHGPARLAEALGATWHIRRWPFPSLNCGPILALDSLIVRAVNYVERQPGILLAKCTYLLRIAGSPPPLDFDVAFSDKEVRAVCTQPSIWQLNRKAIRFVSKGLSRGMQDACVVGLPSRAHKQAKVGTISRHSRRLFTLLLASGRHTAPRGVQAKYRAELARMPCLIAKLPAALGANCHPTCEIAISRTEDARVAWRHLKHLPALTASPGFFWWMLALNLNEILQAAFAHPRFGESLTHAHFCLALGTVRRAVPFRDMHLPVAFTRATATVAREFPTVGTWVGGY